MSSRLVHRRDGEERVLATDVETADSIVAQGLGLMFRRSIPEEYALVFPFERATKRRLHMLFVPFDIDAIWVVDGRVEETKRLPAWTGRGSAVADVVVELPAGSAADVEPGDEIRLVE